MHRHRAIDKKDMQFIKKMSIEYGIAHGVLLEIFTRYYMECILEKLKSCIDFKFGGLVKLHFQCNKLACVHSHYGMYTFHKRFVRLFAFPCSKYFRPNKPEFKFKLKTGLKKEESFELARMQYLKSLQK